MYETWYSVFVILPQQYYHGTLTTSNCFVDFKFHTGLDNYRNCTNYIYNNCNDFYMKTFLHTSSNNKAIKIGSNTPRVTIIDNLLTSKC